MAIYLGSRYENSVVDFFSYRPEEDPRPTIFYNFNDGGYSRYVEYIWKDGDRMDQLASQFFSYPQQWWFIAQANPSIPDFLNITPGTKLRIPRV